MKKLLKAISRKVCESSYQDAIQIIKNTHCSVISFDIFDTLIKRNISEPQKVFDLLQNEFKKIFKSELDIKQLRINSERELIRINPTKENTLLEIYENIKNLNEYERKWLIKNEELIELKLCQKNVFFFDLYQWCIKNNKKVYIVSDMYLSKDIIEKILINSGYSDWSGLFVSSEFRKRKSSGELFKYVLQQINCKADDVIHIGDSLRGDYLEPKRMGLNAVLIPTVTIPIKTQNIGCDIIESFINNNHYDFEDEYYNIGYSVLGPALYGYTVWLGKQLKDKKISKVFFLMREGKLLKSSFDIVNDTDIESKLLYVSRRAVTFSRVKDANNLDDIIGLMHMNRGKLTVRSLLSACLYSEEEIMAICDRASFDADVYIESLTKEMNDCLYDIIQDSVKCKATTQWQYLKLYLNQIGFTNRVAVADVGWHGTIQEGLLYFDMAEISGFYIGTKNKAGAKSIANAKGYYFENNKNYKIQREIMFSVDLFEMMFLCTEGSTIGYEEINGKIYPQKNAPEHSLENAMHIEKMQDAALEFIKDFKNAKLNIFDLFNEKDFIVPYENLVNPPKIKTINMFSNFLFLNMDEQKLIPDKGLLYYGFHPKEFKSDFMNTGCKLFFMKKLFKLPLPYFEILCFLKKFDK